MFGRKKQILKLPQSNLQKSMAAANISGIKSAQKQLQASTQNYKTEDLSKYLTNQPRKMPSSKGGVKAQLAPTQAPGYTPAKAKIKPVEASINQGVSRTKTPARLGTVAAASDFEKSMRNRTQGREADRAARKASRNKRLSNLPRN